MATGVRQSNKTGQIQLSNKQTVSSELYQQVQQKLKLLESGGRQDLLLRLFKGAVHEMHGKAVPTVPGDDWKLLKQYELVGRKDNQSKVFGVMVACLQQEGNRIIVQDRLVSGSEKC